MATTSSPQQERESSVRPRIIDVSDLDYASAASHVAPEDTAYFERRPGRTTLVVR